MIYTHTIATTFIFVCSLSHTPLPPTVPFSYPTIFLIHVLFFHFALRMRPALCFCCTLGCGNMAHQNQESYQFDECPTIFKTERGWFELIKAPNIKKLHVISAIWWSQGFEYWLRSCYNLTPFVGIACTQMQSVRSQLRSQTIKKS